MRRCTVFLPASIFCLLATWGPALAGGIPAKTLREVKAATVYVKVQFGLPIPGGKTLPGTGSGFLIRAEGETGYVVTNHHVVSPPKELAGLARIGPVVLVFNSGSPNEKLVEGEILASDPVRDLAVLKVTGVKDLPRPIVLDPDIELVETMTVYAFGFPFGAALATGKLNPAIAVTKGAISSLRNDDRGNIRLVQIDAEINPGNSGGPVVDEKGKLIGVAVSKIDKSRIGFAVPVKPLADMMVGKVASVAFDTFKVERATAQVQVEASLLDPLEKLRDVVIHYAAGRDAGEAPKPDKEGNFPLLKNSVKVALTTEKGKAVGKFSFESKRPGKTKEAITYQSIFVNGEGKKVVSAPATAYIDFTQSVINDRLTLDDPLDRVRRQPSKTFEHPMKRGRHYVIEMHGDPKELDPYLRLENSAGGALAEDDDSAGGLNSLLVFSPPRDDTYTIIATVLRGTGDFNLRIREEEADAVPAKGLVKKARLTSSDPLDKMLQAPSQAFNVQLRRGVRYTIDLKSKDFDAFLRVENMAGVNIGMDDDSGGQLNSQFGITPGQDGIFRVIATSFDRNAGDFELAIREGGALSIGPDGLKIAGTLNAGDPLDPVLGKMRNARCQVFEVTMQRGQRYQIDLISDRFDPYLRLEDSTGRQLAFDDDSGARLDSRIVFLAPADGTYRIYATAFDAGLGPFGLVVRRVK